MTRLSNRKGIDVIFSSVLSMLLVLCSRADNGAEGSRGGTPVHHEPKLENIQSVEGVVTHEDGYNYILYQDMEYLEKGIRQEKADLYLPISFLSDANETYPVVLEIHGGGWVEGEKDWYLATSLAKELSKAGYAVLSIDYKLMKNADPENGTKKQIAWPENLYDCKSAVRFLRKYSEQLHIKPSSIAVMGESAGGHLALLTGYTAGHEGLNRGGLYTEQSNSVAAVVNVYGITDVYRWGAESFIDEKTVNPAKELYWASPLSHVSNKTPPTLTIHGDADELIPLDQGSRLHELLDEYSVENEWVIIKGGRHAFPIIPHETNGQTDSVQTLLDFLGKHLK